MTLQNKTALVTGASRGIGRGIALKLAQNGAFVFVNYVRDESAAQEVVALIKQNGGRAQAVRADVSDLAQHEALFAPVGSLDILVNNAGTARMSAFDEATPEDFDLLFNLNVRGLFFATQRALRQMNERGRIINISSVASRGGAGFDAYAATKGALNTLTFGWAKSVGGRGITVNAVSPGGVETDLVRDGIPLEIQEHIANSSVFKRLGQPDDIAGVVAFLASDEARWITGREIVVDGGSI